MNSHRKYNLKVVHICPTFFDADSVIAGAERYSFELSKAMAKQADTVLVTFGDKRFTKKVDPLTIECYPRICSIKGNVTNPLSFRFLSELASADVIHCHQFKVFVIDLALIFAKLLRKKIFVTDLAGGTDFTVFRRFKLWKSIQAMLLISDFNRQGNGFYPVKKEVIYGGVDTSKYVPVESPEKKKLLFVGRVLPIKGVEVLIKALEPDMHLEVVGRPYDQKYKDHLMQVSEGKQVDFLEDVDDEGLVEKYQQAFVTVIPSIKEGGYTTAMESLACGTPVISTAVGSLVELIKDGETGYLVPANDEQAIREKIKTLKDDPALRQSMAEKGREDVLNRFTWDRVVERCMNAYQEGNRG